MEYARVAPVIAVVLIVGISFASGPVMHLVDLTRSQPGSSVFCDEGGDVAVEVIEVASDQFEIQQQRGESVDYVLETGPAVVNISAVDRCPQIIYHLEVPGLGLTSKKVYFIDNTSELQLRLTVLAESFESHRIQQETYNGTLTIEVQGDDNRTVYQENISISVDG